MLSEIPVASSWLSSAVVEALFVLANAPDFVFGMMFPLSYRKAPNPDY
jgi:hypothetical protein